jgi:hypothetical protein
MARKGRGFFESSHIEFKTEIQQPKNTSASLSAEILHANFTLIRVRMCVRDQKTGAPGAIPTRDLSLRRRALYAAELREHRW